MKRVLVAVVGGTLTLAGVAMLVLPGPGFVFVAAGLAVLATQFAWAVRPLDYAKGRARNGMDDVANSRLRAAIAVLAAIGLMGVGVGELAGLDLPLVNVLTAVLLIASALALLATVAFARRPTRRPGRRPVSRSGQEDPSTPY